MRFHLHDKRFWGLILLFLVANSINAEVYRGEAILPFVKGVRFNIAKGDGKIRFYRLNPEKESQYPKNAWARSLEYAGIRLEFATKAKSITLRIANIDESIYHGVVRRKIVTYRNGVFLNETRIPKNKAANITVKLADDNQLSEYSIYLPFMMYFDLLELRASGESKLLEIKKSKPRVVFYGDSITQGCQASAPDKTFPSIIARELNLNLFNLGLAGAGAGERIIAQTIARMRPDMVVVAYGTNLSNARYTDEQFLKLHMDFLQALRSENKKLPVLVISPVFRPGREENDDDALRLRHNRIRRMEYDVFKKFRAEGDENIYYLNGLELIGPHEVDLLSDKIHPNNSGYARMAKRMAEKIVQIGILQSIDHKQKN